MSLEPEYRDLRVEKRGAVAWITFDRTDRMNALDEHSFEELAAAVEAVGYDSTIGVIVLTGAGDRAFCTGGFLGDLANFTTEQARRLYAKSFAAFQMLRKVPQPIIAAVNGYAVGGGNELVICADLAIASENARFGQTGPRIGSAPVFGGTNLLAMTVGEKKAREICYLCRQYDAGEALALGWINKVVPQAELVAEVERWCEELLDKSPAYLEVAKISSNVWWDMLTPNMEQSRQALLRLAGGPEMTEGATAFMEKRKPDFRQFRT
jgi:2-ketocyclohexanecarboxyl-CoA hydrolase